MGWTTPDSDNSFGQSRYPRGTDVEESNERLTGDTAGLFDIETSVVLLLHVLNKLSLCRLVVLHGWRCAFFSDFPTIP